MRIQAFKLAKGWYVKKEDLKAFLEGDGVRS